MKSFYVCAAALVASCCLFVSPALSQSRLVSPDFSGMNARPLVSVVGAAEELATGSLIVYGGFTHLSDVSARGIARVSKSGIVDTSFPILEKDERVENVLVSARGAIAIALANNATGARSLHVMLEDDARVGDFALSRLERSLANVASFCFAPDGVLYFARTGYRGRNADTGFVQLGRMGLDGEFDVQWRPPIENAVVPRLRCSDSGDVLLSYSDYAPSSSNSLPQFPYVRVPSDSTRPLEKLNVAVYASLDKLELDANDNAYGIETISSENDVRNVLLTRIDRSGNRDASFAVPLRVSYLYQMRVFADRVVIVGEVGSANSTEPLRFSAATVATVMIDSRATSFAKLPSETLSPVAIGHDRSIYATDTADGALIRIDASLVPNTVAIAGGTAKVASMKRIGADTLVSGDFVWWQDGVRYRSLMKLDAAFKPQRSFTPQIDGEVTDVAVTRDGSYLVAGHFSGGDRGRLLRIFADGRRDATFNVRSSGAITVVTIDDQDRIYVGGRFAEVNGQTRPSLARLSTDGSIDTAWSPQVLWSLDFRSDFGYTFPLYVTRIATVTAEDIFVGTDGEKIYNARFAADSGVATATNLQVFASELIQHPTSKRWFGLLFDQNTPKVTYGRLDPKTLAIDPTWSNATLKTLGGINVGFEGDDLLFVSKNFATRDGKPVYVYTTFGVSTTLSNQTRVLAEEQYPWNGDQASPLVDARKVLLGPTGARFLTATETELFVVDRRTQLNDPVNVIEYFIPSLGHYFITGRDDEKAALDALPNVYVRTGASFLVQKANALAAEDRERTQPICRFYAGAPRAPSSNTHFYGSFRECNLLDKYTQFVSEGFDFLAYRRKTERCVDLVRQPVFRLFQPKTSSGLSNHRYIEAGPVRDAMIQQGWIDEGVAFCVAASTSSSQ